MTAARPVLAIDLGGTKVVAALISPDYQVTAREYRPTLAADGPPGVIGRLFETIDHVLSTAGTGAAGLHGISIAAAGAIDMAQGLITLSPNLPGWRDIPLREIVSERYGVSVSLLNDANAAALGEHCLGAGQGVSDLVMVTLGTGIGGGVIVNGRLCSGVSGSAGEVGHMTIDVNGPRCSCGNTGCWEALASGPALAGEAIRRIGHGEGSALVDIVKGKIETITAEKVEAAARNGDPLAVDVVARVAEYLGVGLVNLVNIFNPEMIIVGGGLARMGELLLGPARQVVRERAFGLAADAVRIVPSRLGDDAGLLGAAAFARSLD